MDSYPSLGVQNADDDTNHTPSLTAYSAIYQLWKQVIGDTNFRSEFNQAWMITEFELGDELTQYNCTHQSPVNGDAVYLVCQGKVRLLAFDAFLQKEVSIQLLHPEQFFGGDNAFCDGGSFAQGYQQYRVVGASCGILAQISLQHLDIWLQRYPALYDYFSQISKSRQKLIFFKTLTELRSQKIPTLQKLITYFLNTKISAGLSLRAATSSEGRFWLVSGEVSSASGTQELMVGESWGYPNGIVPDLISQTDLLLFHLPKEHFDLVAEIVPKLKSLKVGNFEEVKNSEENIDDPIESEIVQCSTRDNQHPPRRWFRRTYPFIEQQNSSDCGAASLAMISRYWGKRFSLNSLRSLAHIDSMGAELSDLANAAQSLGYQALTVRGLVSALESQQLPLIAHYQGNHYIVVWQIKDKSVFISDPAIGKRWLTRSEFEANFTGYALLLSPTEHFYAKKSEQISFSRFYQLFRNYRLLLAQIVIVSILLPLLGVTPAVIAQTVIDTVITAKNFDSIFDSINIFALGFLVFGFGQIALTAVRQHLIDYLSNRLDFTLMGDSIKHSLELPLSFFRSRRVGDILSQIQENAKIQRFFTRQAISSSLDGLMMVVYFGLMTYYSWQLTLVVVAFILAMMCLSAAANLFLKKLQREYSFEFATQNSAMVEMFAGVATIKTAAAERELRQHWQESFTQMIKTRQKGQKLTNSLQMASSSINHFGNTAVLWYGTQMVINSQISIGEFVAFNMLVGNTIKPMLALVKLWDEFFDVLISVEKIDDILATPKAENPQKPLIELPVIRGEVHFENVTCGDRGGIADSHSPSANILQNISFHAKPGQTIGIVGASTSDKSILVNLLAGLYRPDSGRILIDGYDTTKVSAYSLRSQLGIVPQEIFLFSGTILENITLYNREFNLEQVETAAKLAGAHAFIQALPLGYSTIIGEGGIKLPILQQRKIAVARALVKNPRILILDEVDRSLDPMNEYQFLHNFARFNRAFINTSSTFRTTFIVSPSLSSILNVDSILVLHRGVLADQGTHEELMRKSTVYPSLVQQQLNT
jgi:ATP-binding cassette subfamily B protein